MQATDRLTDTARWLRYAEEDLTTAEIFLEHSHVPPSTSYLDTVSTTLTEHVFLCRRHHNSLFVA